MTTVSAPELPLTPSYVIPPAASPDTSSRTNPLEAEPSPWPSAEKPAPAPAAPEPPTTNPTQPVVVDGPPLEKTSGSSRFKDGSQTAVHAGGLILDIATESADAFPPLKSVLGGIRALVNTYEVSPDAFDPYDSV